MDRRISALAVVAALALAPRTSPGCSQCLCGSLTPAGYTLLPYDSRWLLGLEDLYVSKSAALEGDEPGRESQREHRVAAFVGWHAQPDLFLRARVPVVFKRLTEQVGGQTSPAELSNGLGDAELLARLDVIHFMSGLQSSGGAGLIATLGVPTGSNTRTTTEGNRLDEHLQPGIGTFAGSIGVAMDRPAGSGALSFSAFARFSGTNSHDYRYGSAVLANVGYAHKLATAVHGTIELNGRYADADAEEGVRVENTGGSVIYLSPGLQWAPPSPVSVNLFLQIPVARSLRGVQTENPGVKLSFSWSPH